MLTSDHALASLSPTPPPPARLTPVSNNAPVTLSTLPCAFFSVPHKMSHVPSLDISRYNSSDHYGFEPTGAKSAEFEKNGSPSSGSASSLPVLGAVSPAFGRNKRKNFQPRCITDEPLSESVEMQSSPDHETEGNNELSTSGSRFLDSFGLLTNPSLPGASESLLTELMHSLGGQNGKSTEQPLDLSGQEQMQRSKLAELILLKNIRNLAAFYPQLSSDNTFSPPRQECKLESNQPTLSLNDLSDSSSGTGNVFPSRLEGDTSESVMNNRESSLEEFLHLYNVNRDHYLRLFQSQQALQQQQTRGAELEEANNLSHRDAETEDLESQASAPEALDKDQREDCESSSLDDTPISLNNGTNKTIDIDKLKQLQQLYRLNLMQQIESNKSLLESSINGTGTDSSYLPSLDSPFQKSLEGNMSTLSSGSRTSDQNNSSYIKDLFNKSKASSNKTTSRRPLSSWKQSISACGPGPAPWVDKQTLHSLGIQTELINKSGPIDYTHYVKRYANALECGNHLCKELHYREHFHCNALSCNSRVFMKKEEMIRHFKWHKKRDESLTHGFLRCSPCDNCAERFRNCPHHRKQTHYHCLKRGCDKVYISTSDVQMHANYHRKDTAIIQEGFQRFRATENCLLETCAFFGQKTTHFHCRRDNCNHTFKNKADMEKHKSYHIRDEQLARDGFKKFMKHETCTFDECRSSRVCNHIHCIRPGCSHVLHSTGQLYPHKRKHERRENELAYRKYRLAQSIHRSGQLNNNPKTSGINLDIRINESLDHFGEDDPTIDTLARQLPLAQISAIPLEDILGEISESRCLKYLQRHVQRSEQCHFECDPQTGGEHFSCLECRACWAEYSGALEHARRHVVQEEASKLMFEETTDINVCNAECPLSQSTRHLHCRLYGCIFVAALHDTTLSKLDHYQFHEENLKLFSQSSADETNPLVNSKSSSSTPNSSATLPTSVLSIEQLIQMKFPFNKMMPQQAITTSKPEPTPTLQVFPTGTTLTSVDGLPILKRKRGRPPKNRANELLELHKNSVLGNAANTSSPFAAISGLSALELANALNLPMKHANTISNIGASQEDPSKTIPIPLIMPYLKSSSQNGFYVFDQETLCPDVTCIYFGQKHFHCSKPRCYYSTNRDDILLLHSKDFHDNIDIMEGFVYFDENVDCKLPSCPSNKSNKHFHCTRAGCNFSFVRYSTMSTHEEKHRSDASNQHQFGQSEDESEVAALRSDEPSARFFQATTNEHGRNEGPAVAPIENINLLSIKSDTHENSVINQSESEASKDLSMLQSLQKLFHEQAKSTSGSSGATLPTSLTITPTNSTDQGKHSMYSETNPCNSPFCKLKRRCHYHCNTCNQAFSSLEKLLSHSVRHMTSIQSNNNTFLNSISGGETGETEELDQNKMEGDNSLWNNLQVHFAQNPALANNFLQLFMSSWMNSLPTTSNTPGANSLLPFGSPIESPTSNLLRKQNLENLTKRRNSFSSDGSNNDNKRFKMDDDTLESTICTKSDSRSSDRDSSSNSSYLRFRFNEDCGFTTCVYREHQTHFHCMRKDCGYSFCDKTRFVQHTARHERLDTLMGGDFQQFRSTVNCGQAECAFANVSAAVVNKTSHFHCLKCDYVCADTNKVVAHRRQHAKMDNISAAGFEKFAPGQDCQKEMCNYKLKQTHYHCLTCHYSVLGLSQMSSHKLKHHQQQHQHQAAPLE